jgi:hypothetical protein
MELAAIASLHGHARPMIATIRSVESLINSSTNNAHAAAATVIS